MKYRFIWWCSVTDAARETALETNGEALVGP